MDEEIREVLSGILKNNQVCGIASESEEGPWIATTYYAEDGIRLYCLLTHGTKTIANVQRDQRIAFSIDDKKPDNFIQGSGNVEILYDENEIEKGKKFLLEKIPEIAPFMEQPNFSIVKINPTRIFVTSFSKGWFPAKTLEL